MSLIRRDCGGAGVPIKGSNCAGCGCVVLETVLDRHCHVATLILGHLDLPLPGGCCGAGININVDGIALVRGRDPHVLSGVVSTDYWWRLTPWVGD